MIRLVRQSRTWAEYTDLIVRVPFVGRVRVRVPITVRIER